MIETLTLDELMYVTGGDTAGPSSPKPNPLEQQIENSLFGRDGDGPAFVQSMRCSAQGGDLDCRGRVQQMIGQGNGWRHGTYAAQFHNQQLTGNVDTRWLRGGD
jgi:hypothetical protein